MGDCHSVVPTNRAHKLERLARLDQPCHGGKWVTNLEDAQFVKLDKYLDQKDRDMLIMNLEACSAILVASGGRLRCSMTTGGTFNTPCKIWKKKPQASLSICTEWFLLDSMMETSQVVSVQSNFKTQTKLTGTRTVLRFRVCIY